MDYVEINLNPKGKKTGDCGTRAIAQATGASIEDVLNQEVKVYLETGYAIGMPQNEDAVLTRYGFAKMKKPFKSDGTTYSAGEMDRLISNRDIAVLILANHLACVKKHCLIDIWNCGSKSVYGYWVKKNCSDKELKLIGTIKNRSSVGARRFLL